MPAVANLADFADDYFSLPPLDIYCAVTADATIDRLVEQLEDGCHEVRLARCPGNAYSEICAWAPDVLLIDATTPDGVALARRVRAQFGQDIMLIGLHDRKTPQLPVGLFCELLPKPARYLDLARLLGLVPDVEHHDEMALDYARVRAGTNVFEMPTRLQ
jgi:CheY-like chemotaxis protein